MGQQQLLLLVLGVIAVGLAVVVGLQLFSERARQSAADQLVDRNVDIATRAKTWRLKQFPLDGGTGKYDGLEENLRRLVIEQQTAVGCHQITKAEGQDLEVVGVSTRHPDVGVKTIVKGNEIQTTNVRFDGSISAPAGC